MKKAIKIGNFRYEDCGTCPFSYWANGITFYCKQLQRSLDVVNRKRVPIPDACPFPEPEMTK